MFTGIVEELGSVRSIEPHGDGVRIAINSSVVLEGSDLGASIAVNGCCLTLTSSGETDGQLWWTADAVPETMDRTNLGELGTGSPVNLERPMAANGRFGGHIVQGHVDGVTTVLAKQELDDGSWRMSFAVPPALGAHIVHKGSICLDGISLTVADIGDTSFDIAVIPHTLAVTTLGHRDVGDTVNIETDILGKHVEKLLLSGRLGGLPTTQTPEMQQ